MANCLYGITMQEEGVSRKIEVCLEKYEPSEEAPDLSVLTEEEEEEELQESLDGAATYS